MCDRIKAYGNAKKIQLRLDISPPVGTKIATIVALATLYKPVTEISAGARLEEIVTEEAWNAIRNGLVCSG